MELSVTDFEVLRAYIQKVSGISLADDKMYLVKQRLEPLVISEGCKGFSDFVQKLLYAESNALRDSIILSITTNETYFFRDIHPFEMLEKHLLPELGKMIRVRKQSPIPGNDKALVHILSAGASTGQEAYCIAMLIYEYVKANCYSGISPGDFSIMGVDISKKVLQKAISGIYTDAELNRGLNTERKNKYFEKFECDWQIITPIRNMVRFHHMNINDTFAFYGMKFDIIFCRNVLIYFDLKTKVEVFSKLHDLLIEGGYLILGSMENTYMMTDQFEHVHFGNKIFYRKKNFSNIS